MSLSLEGHDGASLEILRQLCTSEWYRGDDLGVSGQSRDCSRWFCGGSWFLCPPPPCECVECNGGASLVVLRRLCVSEWKKGWFFDLISLSIGKSVLAIPRNGLVPLCEMTKCRMENVSQTVLHVSKSDLRKNHGFREKQVCSHCVAAFNC